MELINSVEQLRFIQAERDELSNRLASLEAREQKNFALLEKAGALVVKFDREFRYVYINSNVRNYSGLSPQDYLHKTNEEVGIAKERTNFWNKQLKQVFQSGEEIVFNFEADGPSGKHCYQSCFTPEFNNSGQVETVVGITTIAATEVEQKQSCQDLIEKLPLIVWLSQPQSGPFYINQYWTEYSGLTETASILGGWKVAIHPEDAATVFNKLKEYGLHNEAFEVELRLRRTDGSYRWHQLRSLPVFSPNKDSVDYWIGTCQDIDDLKQAENRQRELNEFKDLFFSMAAHELRGPLTSVQGFAQLLQRNLVRQEQGYQNVESQPRELLLQQSERNQQSVKSILHQAKQMNNLISQMLDMSRLENRKLELNLTTNGSLAEIVERIVEQRRVTTNSHSLQFSLTEDTKPFIGNFDPDRLEQVLNNLMSNAVKYSPAGTKIEIGLQRCEKGSSPMAVISVRDYGIGIKPEDQEYIFDRFYRVRSKNSLEVEGLGLGLYICAEIVNLHNGRIWLESALGQGSIFYFSLPLTS